jgi:hypothetical protein
MLQMHLIELAQSSHLLRGREGTKDLIWIVSIYLARVMDSRNVERRHALDHGNRDRF